jgi:hypothetical protein
MSRYRNLLRIIKLYYEAGLQPNKMCTGNSHTFDIFAGTQGEPELRPAFMYLVHKIDDEVTRAHRSRTQNKQIFELHQGIIKELVKILLENGETIRLEDLENAPIDPIVKWAFKGILHDLGLIDQSKELTRIQVEKTPSDVTSKIGSFFDYKSHASFMKAAVDKSTKGGKKSKRPKPSKKTKTKKLRTKK